MSIGALAMTGVQILLSQSTTSKKVDTESAAINNFEIASPTLAMTVG